VPVGARVITVDYGGDARNAAASAAAAISAIGDDATDIPMLSTPMHVLLSALVAWLGASGVATRIRRARGRSSWWALRTALPAALFLSQSVSIAQPIEWQHRFSQRTTGGPMLVGDGVGNVY
jgi:hypothetical protein